MVGGGGGEGGGDQSAKIAPVEITVADIKNDEAQMEKMNMGPPSLPAQSPQKLRSLWYHNCCRGR